MMEKVFTLGKIGENAVNEDSVLLTDDFLAVSDGAGGGGLFAEKWSAYLLKNLPSTPLTSAEALDAWVDGIWQPFYDEYEAFAKQHGGLTLQKFYDEGSFATLAAVWTSPDNVYKWLTYGDSAVFHYNCATDVLECSISALTDFNAPPFLINYLDKIKPEGVRTGEFHIGKESVVFAATDALSHYILMRYMLSHNALYAAELQRAAAAATKNSNFLNAAMSLPVVDFYTDVVKKLFLSDYHLTKHLEKMYRDKLIALDDYSVAAIFV